MGSINEGWPIEYEKNYKINHEVNNDILTDLRISYIQVTRIRVWLEDDRISDTIKIQKIKKILGNTNEKT